MKVKKSFQTPSKTEQCSHLVTLSYILRNTFQYIQAVLSCADYYILRRICKESEVERSLEKEAYVNELSLQNEAKGCPKVV